MRNKDNYKPHKDTAQKLMLALQIVKGVDYLVSARWVFYRLLQLSYYKSKSDYDKLLNALSRARHAGWGGWQPDTLADATREAVERGQGSASPTDWLHNLAAYAPCKLDAWQTQPYYVEAWFEARAMTDQFRYYTDYLTLRPMGGQASIPYKKQAARGIERAADCYGHPVKILYFGDLDKAGKTIADVVEHDVRKWCAAPFEFINCGLTLDQVQRYSIPENPGKPGEFQWEALPDAAAREIITTSVDQYVSHDAFSEMEARQKRATAWLQSRLPELIAEYVS